MSRREFPKSVRVAVIKRSTRDNVIYCEKCGLPAKRFQIDHVIADSHGGKPIEENAQLLCEPCYSVKNPQDTTIAAKLKRVEAHHLGAKAPSKRPLKSAGFPKKERKPKAQLAPRAIYKDI